MTLDETITWFERVMRRDDSIKPDFVLDLCSGGEQKKGAPLPALYADKEDALTQFRFALLGQLFKRREGAFKWIEKPTLQKFQMTMMDERGSHRLVTDRYSVSCRIAFA